MYSGQTETLIMMPLLPQTTTTKGYSSTLDYIAVCGDAVMSEIDSALVRRYSIPFGGGTSTGSVPPMIRSIARDMTVARVANALYPRDGTAVNEWVPALVEAAQGKLDKLVNREGDLVDTAGSIVMEQTSELRVQSSTQNYSQSFNLDGPLSWRTSSTQLQDIADDREAND